MVLISSCDVEGCHASCRTGCSWTRADVSPGVPSRDHIQTTFDLAESTAANRVPSALNVIMDALRGVPDDGSALMLNADELEVSTYSASPRAFVNRSRQIRDEVESS
jgi:hypothetical protein